MIRHARVLATAAVFGVLAATCAGSSTEDTAPDVAGAEEASDPTDSLAEGELPEGHSALVDMNDPTFPDPLVDPADVISGGPSPDGIPPIDEPTFVSVEAADEWLEDQEPVVVLELEGDARAYPIQILMWHEIVNDTVAGTPVTVTYCPLCNTAVSYKRVVNGAETTFGTSGRLFASALVMYDRATQSLWTHFDGRAVIGVLTGAQLETIPSPLLAWSDFAAQYPDGEVLDRETGFSRPYGTNPYEGYDDPDSRPFLFRGDADTRAKMKQRVVGVAHEDAAKAWTLQAISSPDGVAATSGEVGGQAIVILWKGGQSSALETDSVDSGRDVGSVGVFVPEADGRSLTFRAEDGRFVDEETGSTWAVTGTATAGPLEGETLERLHHFDTFWFAWSTYRPGTELVEEGA
ncbi:MAG: DUF3179 domain-containing protein [Nitriliruptorales bacterium]